MTSKLSKDGGNGPLGRWSNVVIEAFPLAIPTINDCSSSVISSRLPIFCSVWLQSIIVVIQHVYNVHQDIHSFWDITQMTIHYAHVRIKSQK